MDITFEGRPTQEKLYNTILGATKGTNPYTFIDSGGAIRGAKSFTNSLALLTLCKMYPLSKWSIHRKDMTILEATTVETISKIVQGQKNWHWSKRPGNYHLTYKPNNARLLFVGANESRDKDFTDTLGLEINGAFFDQLEDVSKEYYDAVCQRLGSWHIPKEPRPVCLSTFNPHPGWIKKEKYLKYKEGGLRSNELYVPLSPMLEPSNTQSQWDIWKNMPPDVYLRMIEGDWNSFENKNPFFYAYKEDDVVVDDLPMLDDYETLISFDFNINPATCIVGQVSIGSFIRINRAFKIPNCPLRDLCNRLLAIYPNAVFKVTGDPTGNNRNQGYTSPNETMYSIIREEMSLSRAQVERCPIYYSDENAHREIRIFMNTIFQNHPNIMFDKEGTKELRTDINLATTEPGKDKLYKTSGDSEYGMHLADCLIYFFHTFLMDYLKH
jgi:hypothetical protein